MRKTHTPSWFYLAVLTATPLAVGASQASFASESAEVSPQVGALVYKGQTTVDGKNSHEKIDWNDHAGTVGFRVKNARPGMNSFVARVDGGFEIGKLNPEHGLKEGPWIVHARFNGVKDTKGKLPDAQLEVESRIRLTPQNSMVGASVGVRLNSRNGKSRTSILGAVPMVNLAYDRKGDAESSSFGAHLITRHEISPLLTLGADVEALATWGGRTFRLSDRTNDDHHQSGLGGYLSVSGVAEVTPIRTKTGQSLTIGAEARYEDHFTKFSIDTGEDKGSSLSIATKGITGTLVTRGTF